MSALAGIEPIERPPIGRHAHHLYVVRIDPALAGADRDRYASALMAENISTGLHFLPVHTLTWYRDHLPACSLPVTEAAGATVLSLPLSAAHRAADMDDVLAGAAQAPRRVHEMSRRDRVGLGTIVSAVVLAALLWFTDPAQIWDTLSAADMRWVAAATLVNIATVPVMAWRWKLLLRAKGIPVPIGWLTRTYFVALFLGQFLPAAIGGDAVRAVELGRRTHDAPEAVASVLIDRLVGVVSLVALAVVAYAAGGGSGGRPEVAVAEAMFGLAALAILGAAVLRPPARAGGALPRAAGGRPPAGGRAAVLRRAARLPRPPGDAGRRVRAGAGRPGGAVVDDLDAGAGAAAGRAVVARSSRLGRCCSRP